MIRTIVHFVFLALVGAATLVMSGPADSAERAPAALVAAIEPAPARRRPAGAVVDSDAATGATARPGEPVKVVLISGGLAIEQNGRAVPCVHGRSCAVLTTGKHVEGDLVAGRLLVTLP